MTPEHRAAMKAGREAAQAEGRMGKRKPREKPSHGRFILDSKGNLTIFDAELKHALELDQAAAVELAAFLLRCIAPGEWAAG